MRNRIFVTKVTERRAEWEGSLFYHYQRYYFIYFQNFLINLWLINNFTQLFINTFKGGRGGPTKKGKENISERSGPGSHFKDIVWRYLHTKEKCKKTKRAGKWFNLDNTCTDGFLWLSIVTALYEKQNNSNKAKKNHFNIFYKQR